MPGGGFTKVHYAIRILVGRALACRRRMRRSELLLASRLSPFECPAASMPRPFFQGRFIFDMRLTSPPRALTTNHQKGWRLPGLSRKPLRGYRGYLAEEYIQTTKGCVI